MKTEKWYQLKLLFLEYCSKKYFAVRYYILFKATNKNKVIKKANILGGKTEYPYDKKGKVEWKYLGVENVLECFQSPKNGTFLSCFKDSGQTWEDAVQYTQSYSDYESSRMKKSPQNLYLTNLVYFIKASQNAKRGKVTTCQMLFKNSTKNNLLSDLYKLATNKVALKSSIKIRLDCKSSCVSEFVGVGDVMPVYDSIHDGMEIWRSTERFSSKSSISKLIK